MNGIFFTLFRKKSYANWGNINFCFSGRYKNSVPPEQDFPQRKNMIL
jgi:hypothetical protein